MRKAIPNINQTLCAIRTIRYCQPEEPCDRCGTFAPKYSTTHRTARNMQNGRSQGATRLKRRNDALVASVDTILLHLI